MLGNAKQTFESDEGELRNCSLRYPRNSILRKEFIHPFVVFDVYFHRLLALHRRGEWITRRLMMLQSLPAFFVFSVVAAGCPRLRPSFMISCISHPCILLGSLVQIFDPEDSHFFRQHFPYRTCLPLPFFQAVKVPTKTRKRRNQPSAAKAFTERDALSKHLVDPVGDPRGSWCHHCLFQRKQKSSIQLKHF